MNWGLSKSDKIKRFTAEEDATQVRSTIPVDGFDYVVRQEMEQGSPVWVIIRYHNGSIVAMLEND
jgi:hypothetical protein